MKTPAAAPIAAPRASPIAFWVSSAFASAISSRTSSVAFSLTSWIALPRSDVCWSSVIPLVHEPLEDAGDDERAAEREPGDHLRALERRRLARGGRRRRLVRR